MTTARMTFRSTCAAFEGCRSREENERNRVSARARPGAARPKRTPGSPWLFVFVAIAPVAPARVRERHRAAAPAPLARVGAGDERRLAS